MQPFKFTRTMRLAPAVETDGTRSGLCSTWDLIEHDGFELVRGCLKDFVQRINSGAAVLPVLWQHARMQPAIGRVLGLAEDEPGCRFRFRPNTTDLARSVEINMDDGTATDVSVQIVAFDTDPKAPHRIIRAEFDEISICTTGFAADQGAGLGRINGLRRLGLYDAAYVLETIHSLRSAMDRLTSTLTQDPDYDWGVPVSDELDAAVRAEAADLENYTREQFAKLTEGN